MVDKKVEAFLKAHQTPLENTGIIVGVSGGPDSLALLHFLWSQAKKRHLKLVAAHVDHMFRGEESANEAKFVEEFCGKLKIPFEMKSIDVPKIIKSTNKNPQVAARECRYQFFRDIMQKYQYPFLALGHHGDDQVETVLMRLVRGSTGRARAGISFKRPFGRGEIIRPFLCLNREEIEAYCLEHKLNPRRDPSNEKDVYSRNRIRKYVLPFLRKENGNIHLHFQRFSEELQQDEDFLQELTIQKMNKVIKKEKDKMSVNIKSLKAMPIPLQRRGIQLILNYLYQDLPTSLSAIHIDQFFALIESSNPSGCLDFPHGLRIIRSYDDVYFLPHSTENSPYHYEINGLGNVLLPNGHEISIEVNNISIEKLNANQLLLNKNEFSFPIIIRTRKDGDRMRIKGMNGTRKIKDIFIDAKIPIHLRNEWPIITDSKGTILWIPGIKKADTYQREAIL